MTTFSWSLIWSINVLFRIPEQREHDAATKIQKIFRGFWVRHIKNTRFPGDYFEVLKNFV